MPSKAEQICARIEALLLAGATAAGTRVYRDREDAFTREESPAVLIECVDEETRALGGGAGPFLPLTQTDDDTLRVAVTVVVRGAAWQSVADGVRVAAHALIVADATLRTIAAHIVRDRCEWRAASTDLPFGYAAQMYRFRYHTRAQALDLSQ
jgi:hypothetical protein